MKYSIILYPILIIIFFSCMHNQNYELTQNKDITKMYNKDEILLLNKIVDTFDTIVIEYTNESNFQSAYSKFFESFKNKELPKSLKSKIYNNSVNLVKELNSKGMFKEIWIKEYGIDYKTKDTLSYCLLPNTEGKYIKLLKLLEKKDTKLKEYTHSIEDCACISPSVISGSYQYFSKFNINKKVNRLIIAVHFITISSKSSFTSPHGNGNN